jgi:peptidoglycan LD-endopeptidase CwlK
MAKPRYNSEEARMLWILTLAVLGGLALSWWALPELRAASGAWARRRHQSWVARWRRSHRQVQHRFVRIGGQGRHAWRVGTARLRSRWRECLLVLALLALPPAIAWWLHDARRVADYGLAHFHAPTINDQIAWLLQGERLSLPAPLPPAVFETAEVEALRPGLIQASRDWTLLDDDFRQRLLRVYRLMRERHGYEMVLIEGYRSPQRQALLQAMGPHVTQAGPNESYHQHGLAADSAFLRDGVLVISEKDPWAMEGYRLYGELAEAMGLTWGGRWKMRDYGHVELRSASPRPTTPSVTGYMRSPR